MAMLQEEARGDLSTSLAPFLAVPLPWIATNIRTKREARVLLNIGITARRFDELTRHLTTSVLQARSAATQYEAITSTARHASPRTVAGATATTHDVESSLLPSHAMPTFAEACGASPLVTAHPEKLHALLPVLRQAQATLRTGKARIEANLRECRGEFLEQREQLDFFVEANLSAAKEFAEEGLTERAKAKKWIAGVEVVLGQRLDSLVHGDGIGGGVVGGGCGEEVDEFEEEEEEEEEEEDREEGGGGVGGDGAYGHGHDRKEQQQTTTTTTTTNNNNAVGGSRQKRSGKGRARGACGGVGSSSKLKSKPSPTGGGDFASRWSVPLSVHCAAPPP